MKIRLLILSLFSLFILNSASAQIDKGSRYLGGSLSYSYDGGPGTTTLYNFPTGYTNYTVNKMAAFEISPEFGYFLSNKWAIGIQPNYSRSSGTETNAFTATTGGAQSYTTVNNYHIDVVGLTVNLRYYCMLTDRIGIFPQFGISTQNNVKDFGDGELTLLASPNIVFFATPKLGINMGFGNLKYATDYHFKYNYFNLGFNNAISFGLNYYWSKK